MFAVLTSPVWMVSVGNAQLANPIDPLDRDESGRKPFAVGIAFSVSEPKKDFRENVGKGYGVTGTFQYHVDRAGWFNLRFDGSYLEYGREKFRVPFSRNVGGRVLVDVATTNWIAGFAFGPEVGVPSGPVRPYLNAGFSGLLFRTVSSVRGIGGGDGSNPSTTNLSDFTGAWVVGGGLRVPLGGSEVPIELDLGVRYHRGGRASYLREGSIIDNPRGPATILPLTSTTPFIVYSVGVRFRFGFSQDGPCPPSCGDGKGPTHPRRVPQPTGSR